MKIDYELCSQLEDIHFKYERMCALVTCLQCLVADGAIEVREVPENMLDFALYEICTELCKSNEALGKLIKDAERIKE